MSVKRWMALATSVRLMCGWIGSLMTMSMTQEMTICLISSGSVFQDVDMLMFAGTSMHMCDAHVCSCVVQTLLCEKFDATSDVG